MTTPTTGTALNTSEPEYVYGYGKTKHILDYREVRHFQRWTETVEIGLCGAAGGHPDPDPNRPVCKRCARAALATDTTTEDS